ncbi:MAG: PQQ-binding-like beta-propeller repeat protein [Methanobacteriota archaeon]
MRKITITTKPYSLLLIIILLLSSIIPVTSAVTLDQNDGIWVDAFESTGDVTLTHCTISGETILLANESTNHTYDFTQIAENKAYTYKTPIFLPFLPPQLHRSLESELSVIGYIKLKKIDNDAITTQSSLLRKNVVHHFRIKINQDVESITQLHVTWRGSAENEQTVALYYWQPLTRLGWWEQATTGSSNGSMIILEQDYTGDLFINKDGIIDLCVVASAELGKQCTLATDYIGVTTYGKGYAQSGTATSTSIHPTQLFSWERLISDHYAPTGTSIKYRLIYANGTRISDSLLPGNTNGFTTTPISLIPLLSKISSIKIQANLTTTNPSLTPKIYNWGVLWQTKTNTWSDLFNSDLRVDEQTNINIVNGYAIPVITSSNDWPMVGQNPANTRSSISPGVNNNTLNWYSSGSYQVGGGYHNPVIFDGVVYIPSSDGRTLYLFKANVSTNQIGYSSSPIDQIDIPDLIIKNSPAVTSNLIIVATGNTSAGGVDNKIIAFHRNSHNQAWEFMYPGSPICYYASPVVSEGNIFISSWSGDDSLLESLTSGTNRLIALDGNGNLLWDSELPAASFGSPAVDNGVVVVGCENTRNDSLLAYDSNTGELLWKTRVDGTIGYASPVISGDTVFAVVKESVIPLVSSRVKVVAVDITDGSILWNASISGLMLNSYALGVATPAVSNGILFVASPDGNVYALNTNTGQEKWKTKVYTKGLTSSQVLTSSPAHAEDLIYIGTPDGVLIALDDGTGDEGWRYNQTEANSPVLSSPIVVNGLVYFSDEHGILYGIGWYQEAEEEVITGTLTSIPIRLPTGYVWDKFSVKTYTSSGATIQCNILNEAKKTIVSNVKNGNNVSKNLSGYSSIRLQALFTLDNSTRNATLYNWSIRMLPSQDTKRPVIYESSFKPSSGWATSITPTCSINCSDPGKGLLVSSANYTIEYKLKGQTTTKTYTGRAQCTGTNGSTQMQIMSVNLSKVSFSTNISEVTRIRFSIQDLAGNSNTSQWHQLRTDTVKPTSQISNAASIPEKCTTSPLTITATASDTGSGLKNVGLYYRSVSDTTWKLFSTDTVSPYSWSFTITSGEYEITSIATDVAENREDYPDEGEATFIFDPNPPTKPSFPGEPWVNASKTIPVTFQDDYQLDTIEYHLQGEATWKSIASEVNQATYNTPWMLGLAEWDALSEGTAYELYFKISDICGNTYTSTQSTALEIRKDTTAPIVNLDISEFTTLQLDNTFNLTASISDNNGSGVKQIQLYYRYSEDNDSWTDWEKLGDTLTAAPFTWEFTAEEGNGQYQFKLIAEDKARNQDVVITSVGVSLFPLMLFIVLLVLFVLFVVLALFRLRRWKKQKS